MQSAQDWLRAACSLCLSCYFSLIALLLDTMLCIIGRLRGRALFRQKLLSHEGALIEVPDSQAQQGVSSLVAYLKPRLEAAAGGSLDAYAQ